MSTMHGVQSTSSASRSSLSDDTSNLASLDVRGLDNKEKGEKFKNLLIASLRMQLFATESGATVPFFYTVNHAHISHPVSPPERLSLNQSSQTKPKPTLIDLCPAKNAPHKCISRKKADRAGEQAVDQAGQEAVAEKQYARNETVNVQPGRVVPDTVGEDPEGAGTADDEALPPPVVVLETRQFDLGCWGAQVGL